VTLPAFEAIMAQKYRFQDTDEKCRQTFRQFDHGKGYITIDVRSAAACLFRPRVLGVFLNGQ